MLRHSSMAVSSLDPFTDYSRTQRIVLLLDLNPLINLPDPNQYIKSLISAAKTLLTFPSLSNSIFSFRGFFSSLSPVLSSSKLPVSSLSLSFDSPGLTLQALTRFLKNLPASIGKGSPHSNASQASNLAASMYQIIHDYGWDLVQDPVPGKSLNCDSRVPITSNLVVLVSPVIKELNVMAEFLGVEAGDDCLRNEAAFTEKLSGVFRTVIDAFLRRDIHCCWVALKSELGEIGLGKSEQELGFLENGIKNLGWGFCSGDAMVLGSALVPFGLIYPKMGFLQSTYAGCDVNSPADEAVKAQLSLEISDVNGQPLECNCCELEFLDITAEKGSDVRNGKSMVDRFCKEMQKIRIKAVRKYDQLKTFDRHLCNEVLLRESLGDHRVDKNESFSDFYAYKLLQMLVTEIGEYLTRKPVPIWPMLLSFLYRNGYCALVSLSDGNSDLRMGILKPFTISSAKLCILDDDFYSQNKLMEMNGADSAAFPVERDGKVCDPAADGGQRKKSKKILQSLHDLTWDTFCQAAFDHLRMDLEEVYFAGSCNNSKKLKFMKCWMKQIKNFASFSFKVPDNSKTDQVVSEDTAQRATALPLESQPQASCSASLGEGFSQTVDESANDLNSESLESFFSSLANKIHQGLESEEVDLAAFAERLVTSCIFRLYQKHEARDISEEKSGDSCGSIVAAELMELLLKEPKDLASLHKKLEPRSQASDQSSTGPAPTNIVREYELQILFRMEILLSEAVSSTYNSEPLKQKFVKHICNFLESIQCHLEGGFFGDWRLDKYVEKLIKSRYCDSLEDVIGKICTRMDLSLFEEEGNESPIHSFNSDEINMVPKERHRKLGAEANAAAARDRSSKQLKTERKRSRGGGVDFKKLREAQEQRERARRFSSFTTWMPDLRRVWAPLKQPKGMKQKSESMHEFSSERKVGRYASRDCVCETPETEKKRGSLEREEEEEEEEVQAGKHKRLSFSPVSRALFQDNT